MNNDLSIVIAAEFYRAEKLAQELEQCNIEITQLSIAEIYPFSEEQGIRFNNRSVVQLDPDTINWSEINYLFFAGEAKFVPLLAKAADAGCIVIDMLGVCASLNDVPLVVPTVNEEQLVELRQRNIVSIPDPQVTQLVLAIAPLVEQALDQVFVTSLLPASYVNGETVEKLAGQIAQLLNGIPLDDGQQRLAFDVFPSRGKDLNAQVQKIFPQLGDVCFHSVQTTVFYGMAQKVTLLSAYDIDTRGLFSVWKQNELIDYSETLITPVTNGETEGNEEITHLHLSQLSTLENGLSFWSVSDEQRFALAALAVKLLESIYHQGY